MSVDTWGARALDLNWLRGRNWWQHVQIGEPDACWPWLRSRGSHGYGQTWDRVTVRLAHRVAWSLHHGQQIPIGMTLDHTCRNRACCNPHHLRLLTNVENARNNGASIRTHCPHGHPYDDENTLRNKYGHRSCRACFNNRKAIAA